MKLWTENSLKKKIQESSKKRGLSSPQLQMLLCQERFFARLGTLSESKYFILKGGTLMLRRYTKMVPPRYTNDIDFEVKGTEVSAVGKIFDKTISVDLDDGISFQGFTTTAMKRETPYGGDRYEFKWTFFKKRISQSLKIDVCAGDYVDPTAVSSGEVFLFSTNETPITLLVYPPEFIFAEKLETMTRFGTGNTRFKDFIDMWELINVGLIPEKVKFAVRECFKRRGTSLAPTRWQEILSDRSFSLFLENARERSFSELELPSVEVMFSEINTYLSKNI